MIHWIVLILSCLIVFIELLAKTAFKKKEDKKRKTTKNFENLFKIELD